MISRDSVYKIGRIGKPHGVDGEVSFHFTDDVFDRTDADYLVLDMDGILVPFFIDEYRFKTDETALVRFEDINSQQRAKELTGTDVYFPREHADSADGPMSWAEIVGYHVVDTATDRSVGVIESVDGSTINTLFELKTESGDELLVPASDELIAGVDTGGRKIFMNLPEGLLDI